MSDCQLSAKISCAGCGAKVGASVLRELLENMPPVPTPQLMAGFEAGEDACVYRLNDEQAIVQTLDFFPPPVRDPYDFGRIAATNALSDVYAMGARPLFALNIFATPKSLPREAVEAVLRGGYEVAKAAGIPITGGHSIYDETLKYGLCATGLVHPDKLWRNHGARPGDLLYLTKPLGIGINLMAYANDLVDRSVYEKTLETALRSNGGVAGILQGFTPHAVTDVTGFSLLGHLAEMVTGSENIGAVVTLNKVPFLPQAIELAGWGVLSEAVYNNRRFASSHVLVNGEESAIHDVLYDPQTSGGLLIALPKEEGARFELACLQAGEEVHRIGWCEAAQGEGKIRIL